MLTLKSTFLFTLSLCSIVSCHLTATILSSASSHLICMSDHHHHLSPTICQSLTPTQPSEMKFTDLSQGKSLSDLQPFTMYREKDMLAISSTLRQSHQRLLCRRCHGLVLHRVWKKHHPSIIFLYKLSQKWTNFNNFWYTESWKQLTLALTHFFHHTWKMSAHYLVKCKIFHLIKVIYDFLPKLDNFEKSWLLQCPETWTSENQSQRSC